MTLAKATVSGDVVKAPEKRFTQNDMPIAGFTISVDGESSTMLRVVAFGNLADSAANSLAVGDKVAVEGRLQANTYKLPNGRDKKIYEINANSIEKIGTSSPIGGFGSSSAPMASSQKQSEPKSENIVEFADDSIAQDLIDEDEIPF